MTHSDVSPKTCPEAETSVSISRASATDKGNFTYTNDERYRP